MSFGAIFMRLSTTLSVCLAAGGGLAAFGLPAMGLPDNLAGVFTFPEGYTPQMLGGFWQALLFGGIFGLILVALIVSGFIGMMRNAPPRPPKAAKEPAHVPIPETLQAV